ncbi:hypothetical protein PVAP13_4KG281305 [Panicum virgatum]|uniref:Uncharacterized protein n=1 Tax=Panicum virgatum TaxID=38727 RepID=A0A8T0TRN1_PANVG|nr:hypothetical protein PVAP13_4KG281305 [Panicum virgatum]
MFVPFLLRNADHPREEGQSLFRRLYKKLFLNLPTTMKGQVEAFFRN